MRKLLSWSGSAAAVLLAVGCGGVSGAPTPKMIPGGGVADGTIDGHLFVYVTDEETRAALSSASVRVGDASDPAPCTVLTDSTGLAKFEPDSCPALKGPVMLTVSATGYAPATWIGVNGTNITLPLRAMNPPAVDSAHGQRDDRGLGEPAGAGHEPPDAGADRLFAVEHAWRSRQRDPAGDARRPGRLADLHDPGQPLRHQRGGQRLQLAAQDPHRGAGDHRDHRRPVQQQHARRRHRRQRSR